MALNAETKKNSDSKYMKEYKKMALNAKTKRESDSKTHEWA